MIEKCSIGNMSYNIQNITLIILILILIIVIIYYLKNSSLKHDELIEKYTNTDIIDTGISDTNYGINSATLNVAHFPTKTSTITLRPCTVHFNNEKSSKYQYKDEWQEIETIDGKKVPSKIFGKDNSINNDEFTISNLNFSEVSKCYKLNNTGNNGFKYNHNTIVEYNNTDFVYLNNDKSKKYMEMNFNYNNNNDDFQEKVLDSICSLQYSKILSGTSLSGEVLYRLKLDNANKITDIKSITINRTNNHKFDINSNTNLPILISNSSTGYRYNNSTKLFEYYNTSSTSSSSSQLDRKINVLLYKFNRELLCDNTTNNILSYSYENKIININNLLEIPINNNDLSIPRSGPLESSLNKGPKGHDLFNAIKVGGKKETLLENIQKLIYSNIDEYNRPIETKIAGLKKELQKISDDFEKFYDENNTRSKFIENACANNTLIYTTLLDSENYNIIKGKAKFKYVNYSMQDNFVRRNEITAQLLIRTSPTTTREVDAYDIKIYKIDTSDKTITFDKKTTCEILIVGGGGGSVGGLGGGGGAGAVVHIPAADIPIGVYNITVGVGGNGNTQTNASGKGGFSSIRSIIGNSINILAEGGGGVSGGYNDNKLGNGNPGGSGGGAAGPSQTQLLKGGLKGNESSLGGFTGTIYGNKGGDNTHKRTTGTTNATGGGGAGSAAPNINPSSDTEPGNGGDGKMFDITGRDIFYGGGGGGGYLSTPTNGGRGGGGNGGYNSNGKNGAPHTGGGGGGGGVNSFMGGNGGSGIVIIKYKKSGITDSTNHNIKILTLYYNIDYNNYPVLPLKSLYAWYKFDGNSNDSSGNNRHMTSNAFSFKYGYNYMLKKHYADMSTGNLYTEQINLSSRAYTMTFWIRANDTTGAFWITQGSSGFTGVTNTYLQIGTRKNNSYCLAFYGNELEAPGEGSSWPYGKECTYWVFMSYVVKQNNNRIIYRNGKVISSDRNTAAFNGSAGITISKHNEYISDLRIYEDALTKEEILSLYEMYFRTVEYKLKNTKDSISSIDNEDTQIIRSEEINASLYITSTYVDSSESAALDDYKFNISIDNKVTSIIRNGINLHEEFLYYTIKYNIYDTLVNINNKDITFSNDSQDLNIYDYQPNIGIIIDDNNKNKYNIYKISTNINKIYKIESEKISFDINLIFNRNDSPTNLVFNTDYSIKYIYPSTSVSENSVIIPIDIILTIKPLQQQGYIHIYTQYNNNNIFTFLGGPGISNFNSIGDDATVWEKSLKSKNNGWSIISKNIDITSEESKKINNDNLESKCNNLQNITICNINKLKKIKTILSNYNPPESNEPRLITDAVITNVLMDSNNVYTTNINELISYESPTEKTGIKNVSGFNIKDTATKYIYFYYNSNQ